MAVEESIALVVVSAGDGKDASECCEVIPLGFLLSFVSLCGRHRSSEPYQSDIFHSDCMSKCLESRRSCFVLSMGVGLLTLQ